MFIEESQTDAGLQAYNQDLRNSEPEFDQSGRRLARLDLTRMFEENEILTQIRAFRHEVGSRLDDMDQRLRKIEAEVSAPAMQNFAARLEEMEQRLSRIECELTGPAAASPPPVP